MSFSQVKKDTDVNFLLNLSTLIQELEDLDSQGQEVKEKTDIISKEISQISLKIKQEQSKFLKLRLQKDFSSLVSRFEKVVKEIQNRKKFKKYVQEQDKEDESTPLLLQSQVVKLDNQIEFNEVLIQEREQDLQGIESSVAQVNEIFRDLGTLVHEQQ
jgi:syntaxin 7